MTTNHMNRLAREVSEKKRYLSELVTTPIAAIAQACCTVLDHGEQLDAHLQQALETIPYCTMLYVTDCDYRQLSSNVSRVAIASQYRGQDLSERPYLQATVPLKGLVLSNSYRNRDTARSCITLVQAIHQQDSLLGFLMADFNLDELPMPNSLLRMMSNWQQFRGDPAIRGSLFSQQRIGSLLDTHINDVHRIIRTLMINNGVFHFKLHYSSSRVTLWLYDQPHHYRLHRVDELLDGSVSAGYGERSYPAEACVHADQLDRLLEQFKVLRFADEHVYLRSASVNIVNGMVGLNFSCDGSHYIPVQEFIDNAMDYWLGSQNIA